MPKSRPLPPKSQRHPPIAADKQTGEPALKGTFVAVLLLGAFIALLWAGVFALFVSRN